MGQDRYQSNPRLGEAKHTSQFTHWSFAVVHAMVPLCYPVNVISRKYENMNYLKNAQEYKQPTRECEMDPICRSLVSNVRDSIGLLAYSLRQLK